MARHLPPEFIESWASGVVTSLEPDAIPAAASPRGWNSELKSAGGQRAAVGKRRGFKTMNEAAVTGGTPIIGMHGFRRRTVGADTFTLEHLLYSQNGRLDVLKSDGTTEPYDSAAATPFTSGLTPPSFAVANNECFIVNGVENKKATTDSTGSSKKIRNVGVARPSAPTLGSSGTGMTGTYQVVLQFYNSLTGWLSSRSDETEITITDKQIDVTIPTTLDAQVTDIRIGIRKIDLTTDWRQVGSVTAGTSTFAINKTDEQIVDLTIIIDDDPAVNDPPPVLSLVEWHFERLFAVAPSAPSNLLYSNLFQPEQFNPDNFEPIGKDDGDKITGIKSAFGILVVFKRNSVWAVYGDDPNTWDIRQIDSSVGCTSHRSIVYTDGKLFWWSEQGPVLWTGDGPLIMLGRDLLSETVGPETLRYSQFHLVAAAEDITNNRILFAVNELSPEGEPNFTNNNILIPFNYTLQRFEATKWNPLDAASLANIPDGNDVPYLYLGGYYGQVFQYGTVDADGAEDGTIKGAVTSATSSTLTDSTATFQTDGEGLKGRYVYVTDPAGISTQRRRIASNTATTLTLDTGLTWNITPNQFYTYVIGGPDWQWDTYVAAPSSAFYKKRFRFLLCQLKTEATEALVHIDLLFDYSNSVGKTLSTTVTPGGGKWNSAVWDVDKFGAQAARSARLRVGATGYAWRARFRNGNPNEPLTLLKAGMMSELLTEKLS